MKINKKSANVTICGLFIIFAETLKFITMNEIIELIRRHIKGQGNQVDISGKLATILERLATHSIPEIIEVTEYATITGGYQIPRLSIEQLQAAYNAIVAGRNAMVVTNNGKLHLRALQADSLEGEICVNFLYYNYALIEYVANGENVSISYKILEGQTGEIA